MNKLVRQAYACCGIEYQDHSDSHDAPTHRRGLTIVPLLMVDQVEECRHEDENKKNVQQKEVAVPVVLRQLPAEVAPDVDAEKRKVEENYHQCEYSGALVVVREDYLF